jgi:hypothetical protein
MDTSRAPPRSSRRLCAAEKESFRLGIEPLSVFGGRRSNRMQSKFLHLYSFYPHSAAVACQCSSRMVPGSSRIETSAIPFEIGNCLTAAVVAPDGTQNRPGCDGRLPDANVAALRPWIVTHLHGGRTAAGSDGWVENAVFPRQSTLCCYDNDQAAAMLWYHDHALGITRYNVYAGLAGLYIIRDAEEASFLGYRKDGTKSHLRFRTAIWILRPMGPSTEGCFTRSPIRRWSSSVSPPVYPPASVQRMITPSHCG